MDMCLLISHLTLPRHSKFIQTLSQSCLSHALLFLAIPGVPSEYCQPGNSNLCPCPCKHLGPCLDLFRAPSALPLHLISSCQPHFSTFVVVSNILSASNRAPFNFFTTLFLADYLMF